ncbi:MAG: UDP-N-acetylmuramoyl-L-alanyl-D-glutamate--2,6-diaminopimelate ligase [Salibacteraceae bacterium]|nr:UDP-N-acetylmuramoyl-L-alanyl-D-glutamate--2,6-diaminopimelate ligase [Salibacteraceae bacterium]MDP4686811.1 UDP-N-acetylmuramoyl-L-alanyl-D-glutamate--2,6-diaminopimelate ligase [Salibacteraceae bacterium]MDP4763115.1 UDP-N-acetylmuramoyl-L-alanyl-D-glutamate--2,6-diaminopimelate ligase [Salibacteraceae bacterium]MDP4844701.1 UDP-N-acetylmuramoyl-L-alanyl-D-glutamate--2,6-diaminopimelate ligase [Salibacteraceae bacterium]MDP4934613.1 UDP-N-acetylmuramoyl-L-alanyl-D-glutamate--2,6-diaminopi
MKLLKDILYKAGIDDVIGNTHLAVEKVCFDSREADKFSAFVAVRGSQTDGHLFISKAIASGSRIIICEEFPEDVDPIITYVKVKDSAQALGVIASNFYDNPSEHLELVGVTGTNGKTTVVTLLYQLFKALGYKCGLISTVGNKVANHDVPATHTTPDPVQLNKLLAQMVEAGCRYAFMEVSSHAVDQKRIAGIRFKGALFTNITRDHLDYHKTFDNYIKAKKGFFDMLPSDAFALINADDVHGEVMLQNTKAKKYAFALKTDADFKAKILENHFQGLNLIVDEREVWTKLIGQFNAYNLLATYAAGVLLGQDKMEVLTMVSNLNPPSGRFQYIQNADKVIGIVDYAHTPDALKNVLSTIASIKNGNEKVITVVGCGGDRDKGKRPQMAKIACELSDKVILTSDNPRTEQADQIIKDMQAGVEIIHTKKTLAITDRREAIKAATAFAEPGDIILVAGKGHETYQEINGVRHDFDDLKILNEMLNLPN